MERASGSRALVVVEGGTWRSGGQLDRDEEIDVRLNGPRLWAPFSNWMFFANFRFATNAKTLVSRPTITRVTFDLPGCKEPKKTKNEKKRKQKQNKKKENEKKRK